MKVILVLMVALLICLGSTHGAEEKTSSLRFTAIEHATFVIQAGEVAIFVDPVGEKEAFAAFGVPDVILITHTHRDHLNEALVKALAGEKTAIIVPASVQEKLGIGKVLANGESAEAAGVKIEAVAMYNTTPERMKFHPKGKGNGYLLTIAEERVYIAGDTEDIPEMRKLRDIDHAFLCMNLPYTMTVEQAASALLEVKPKKVYPYHFRGKDGKMSDIEKFKTLLDEEPDVKVEVLDWYPEKKADDAGSKGKG